MSDEHTLPEDVHDWPSDPFAVLGVPHDADDRTVRRAYARLVKTYKPEVFPDHFQRLREAHDAARERVKWRARFQSHDDEDDWLPASADFANLDLPPRHDRSRHDATDHGDDRESVDGGGRRGVVDRSHRRGVAAG